MPRVHKRKANKDYPDQGIKKGEHYFTWSLKTGPRTGITYKSKTYPRRSQLTTSEFLGTVYDLEDEINELADKVDSEDTMTDLVSQLQDAAGELSNQADELQSRLDNMPEGLQQGSTGELLQNRIDRCYEVQSELESLASDFESLTDEENVDWAEQASRVSSEISWDFE